MCVPATFATTSQEKMAKRDFQWRMELLKWFILLVVALSSHQPLTHLPSVHYASTQEAA